jgi:hypothetical protein
MTSSAFVETAWETRSVLRRRLYRLPCEQPGYGRSRSLNPTARVPALACNVRPDELRDPILDDHRPEPYR